MVRSAGIPSHREKTQQFKYKHPLDYLFYARNVTIVGASPNPNFGAGFFISYKDEAELLGVDAIKHGNGEHTYGPAVIIIGKK